jgi:hypothetical protein
MKTLEARSCEVLRSAIVQGIVDPPFTVHDLDDRWFSYLTESSRKSDIRQQAARTAPYQHPLTRRFQQHGFLPQKQFQVEVGFESLLVECARFDIVKGNIGIVRKVEAFYGDIQRYFATFDPAAVPPIMATWGVPWMDTAEPDAVRFFLRLTPFDGAQRVRHTVSGATNPHAIMRGSPYSDLPEIAGCFYPPTMNHEIWLPVPGGYSLILYAWTPATLTYQFVLAGQLRGIVQSKESGEIDFNMRNGWNS